MCLAATACGSSAGTSSSALPPTAHQETVHLVAEPTLFDLAGKKVWGESYDGSFVGPTLHFTPGEQVSLTLTNKLSTATNLHFHGMHVSPSGDSDNVFLSIPPGDTFTYHLSIPEDQPQGTYWYHDHDMCMESSATATASMPGMTAPSSSASSASCSNVESQVLAGLSGAIVVGDDRSLLPSDLQHITAHTLVFKDVQIDKSGHIVQNTSTESINSNKPTVRLVNGELRPVLTMRPGETQLWRLLNAGADIFYDLQLDGYHFTVIGDDGFPVAQVTTANSLLLPSGKRYDVLVTAGAHPGSTWLRTLAYSNGPQGDSYPDVPLLKLRVAGTPTQPLAMPSGAIPTAPRNLVNAPIAQDRSVQLSENSAGTSFYINKKPFNMNRSIFSTPAVVNTVEQWTIVNASGETHPFHIHTGHFQVMSINGVRQPFRGERDIVPVPYKKDGVPGKVVIRIDFADFTGRWMFHCHIAAHEDNGMMSFVNVVNPPPGFNQSLIVPPAY